MKVSKRKEFNPVTIVLETEEEFRSLLIAMGVDGGQSRTRYESTLNEKKGLSFDRYLGVLSELYSCLVKNK